MEIKRVAWHRDPFILLMKGRRSDADPNRRTWAYSLSVDGEILFSGGDLFTPIEASPFEAFGSLLSFLTLKPGDTDAEYFDSYTDRQREFLDSDEMDELIMFECDLVTDPYAIRARASSDNARRFTLLEN